ncbi:MAG TPA: hypothetical protein VJ385_00785 [Fibrobacteria bacterium]|nr:hypothetical protein [Fibrobacteria bacterium]
MDASKLRNSCICGNTLPYLECCGRFADPLSGADEGPDSGAGPGTRREKGETGDAEAAMYHAFRHGLHELSMALFPLRALYQAYWEKLTKEDYPHDMLMEDPEYGRAVVENFFWDYFVQYSDARPILRTARELEGKDLRLAHDLMQWSYAPLWFYRVQERTAKTARLINLGNLKAHVVHHGGRIPEGTGGVLTRLLPFRGKEFCGHTALAFGGRNAPGEAGLDALFRAGCRELGVKPSVTLRPDVHCDEWRRHGSVFLALWRAEVYDSTVGRPARGSGASSASSGASPAAGASPAPGVSSATGVSPAFRLALRDRDGLLAALASSPETRAAGPGAWDLRFRAMRVARLEARGGNLSVTVADPAFRAHVRDWLRERLGTAVGLPDDPGTESMPGESPESQDVWVHTPSDALNGQTPIQASTHDWGRRRLQLLLKDMVKQGRDIVSLRRQLGL